jgi:sterol 14alpha-demethylase
MQAQILEQIERFRMDLIQNPKPGQLALIGCVVLAIITFLFSFLWKRRPRNAPPNAHIGLPIIGNYVSFLSSPVEFIAKGLEKYGPIFTVQMVGQNLTFLLGPETSAPFYRLSDDYMSQPEVYKFMTPVFGEGIVYDAEQKKRAVQYQTMAQGLKANRLKVYVPKIEKETIEYLNARWGESGTVNLLDALSELTILTASRCLHGDDVRENLFAEVANLYHDLDKGVTPLSFFFPTAPTASHAKRDRARAEMVKIFSKVIEARRASNADSTSHTDILQLFIEMKYKDGTGLTNDQIVGLLIALLFAGQHTSSITSTWTMFFLIHNPRCLREVLSEQKAVLGEGHYQDPLDFDVVGNFEYLQNCVKEALRMHPPLIMLMRMAMQDIDTTVNGQKVVIPKGDICITSPAVSSRMESVFKNPNDFEPERFGPERNEHKTPFAFLGFGGGMHACMGQQFGLLQVKTIVSILLRNYSFEAVENVIPEPDYAAMVVGPKNHLIVRYKKLPESTLPSHPSLKA